VVVQNDNQNDCAVVLFLQNELLHKAPQAITKEVFSESWSGCCL
jgi:hypothetical protein